MLDTLGVSVVKIGFQHLFGVWAFVAAVVITYLWWKTSQGDDA